MSDPFKHPSSSEQIPPQAGPDVVDLIKKIQQHLVFLEKKIDLLIGQSSQRSFKTRPFSKPFWPGGHSHRRENREHNQSRENNFAQGRPFNKQRGSENREGGQRTKPFFHRRKDHG